jgi:hypothetical protein
MWIFIDICFVSIPLHVDRIALCLVYASCRGIMETVRLYAMVGLLS